MSASRNTAVGGFVVGGLVLGLAAVALFGRFNLFHPTTQAVVVFKDSVKGLSVGSPVTFRGVPVGAVARIVIQIDPKSHSAFIPVTLELQPDSVRVSTESDSAPVELARLIAHGLRAELNLQSFVTGQSEVDLDVDPQSPAVLHPDIVDLPEIPTRQSTLERAQAQLSALPLRELAENALVTLQSLRTLSEKLDRDLPPLVSSLVATSDRAAITMADFSRLAAVGERELVQRGADLHTLLAGGGQLVAQARGVVAALGSFASERGAARIDAESALRDLASAAAALRGFAGDVERNPQLLVTGRKP